MSEDMGAGPYRTPLGEKMRVLRKADHAQTDTGQNLFQYVQIEIKPTEEIRKWFLILSLSSSVRSAISGPVAGL